MNASLSGDGAGDARARRRARRLLRAQRSVDRRPGLAVPRAARLAGPRALPRSRRASPRPTAPHRESFASRGAPPPTTSGRSPIASTRTTASSPRRHRPRPVLGIAESNTSSYTIRASDSVGHLSAPLTIRFRLGLGVVDARGKLVRDTVRPPAVGRVSVRRAAKTVRLSWPPCATPAACAAIGSRSVRGSSR